MKRILLALVCALLSVQTAQAISVIQPTACHFFNALGAGASHTSAAIDVRGYRDGAFQVNWSALTGSVDATVKVQVSNDGTNWVDKSGATFNLVGTSGSDLISLTTVTEAYYHIVYDHGSVSGGTLNGYCIAKE